MSDRATSTTIDGAELRACLGRFATGVTVVTYRDADGEPRGATMNAFTSVSLDPPIVLISVARTAKACALLKDVPFCVNILAADQLAVALQFAGKPNARLQLQWDVDGAAPHIADSMAWLECEPWRSYDGGDHVLYLGEVKRMEHRRCDPLLFISGSFCASGIELFHTPRSVLLDGRPVPGWLQAAERLQDHIPLA